jgi:LmbE family N-acetylglucosaminyl deacetylase
VRALILVAHPDDETLGAGGTIPKLVRRGWEVRIVFLSDGIVRARGAEHDNRPDAIAACRRLGVVEPYFLGFPDQKFDTIPMADLAGRVSQLNLQLDLIITHMGTDLNLDHRITCEVAKIVGRPRSKPVAIMACEIPSTTFWNGQPFQANYYVDITQEIEVKVEAFAMYHHECQAYPHPWSEKGLKLLAEYHGMQSGFPMAEAFYIIRGYEGLMPI